MKLIAIEEHFITPDVRAALNRLEGDDRDDSVLLNSMLGVESRLEEIGDERLRLMDESGVDVQVLSLTTPATQTFLGAEAVSLARNANDVVLAAIALHPKRFEGFATLPTPDPQAAAHELERTVALGLKGAMLCGRTRDRNLDHPDFLPIFEAAAALRVPLYIHPQIPVRAVRDAYYSGFGDPLDVVFATGGYGWHNESGIQALRLILSGVFDRFPDLQIILGHWGEVVTFYLERIDTMNRKVTKLERSISEYARQNVYVTPGGILSQSYLSRSIEIVGIERIIFATDYPFVYAPDRGARAFLEHAPLEQAQKAMIAHGNWERLTSNARQAAMS